MNTGRKIGIVVALLMVVALTLAVKQKHKVGPVQQPTDSGQVAAATSPAAPVVVDLDLRITVDQGRAATAPSGDTIPARATASDPARTPAAPSALPRLVDLGAGKCIPCKQMAPILEALKKEYAGRMSVEFIDVWENESAGEKYGIRMIPTQIFFDATGKERFRHEGFFSREDILSKWKELGVDVERRPETRPQVQ